jgi:hypothetical protein
LKTCKCHSNLIETRRPFCVLNFVVFRTAQAEQEYRQQLTTAVDQVDMRIQITGRILRSKEKLDIHAKVPVVKQSKKKKTKALQKLLAQGEDDAGASKPLAPQPTFFALLSFRSSKEYEDFLGRTKHGWDEDGVVEEIITTSHLVLPPKSQPISASDWSYGNPHEPYGQDWFG